MILYIIKQWEENKHKLEEYFRTTPQSEYEEYETIVKKLFELCIPEANKYYSWDYDKMTVIDDGDYQGTLIFVIPFDAYQPDIEQYGIVDTYYGSCSGCDTLLGISAYKTGLPSENQIEQYMTLALHLVQKLKTLKYE